MAGRRRRESRMYDLFCTDPARLKSPWVCTGRFVWEKFLWSGQMNDWLHPRNLPLKFSLHREQVWSISLTWHYLETWQDPTEQTSKVWTARVRSCAHLKQPCTGWRNVKPALNNSNSLLCGPRGTGFIAHWQLAGLCQMARDLTLAVQTWDFCGLLLSCPI